MFVTMFPKAENIHLIKDVGMIPFVLHKELGYEAYIASYDGEDYGYFKTDIQGVQWLKIERKCNSEIINGLLFLLKYARKIDTLNLYHFRASSFIWIIVYKILNMKGKVYLKLDISTESGIKMNMKRGSFKWILTKLILGMCKVISCETEAFADYANEKWPVKISCLPNGVLKREISTNHAKEKIILTVGRLGAKQKAVENLIVAFEEAIAHISEEWKLLLVGPMSDEFACYLKNRMQKNPMLHNRIQYLGEIDNREELASLYSRAAIFTLPSRWESFGLAAIEALSRGDYLLLTNLQSFKEISFSEKYGKLIEIDNNHSYVFSIIDSCQKFEKTGALIEYLELQKDLEEKFCWESICARLDMELERK